MDSYSLLDRFSLPRILATDIRKIRAEIDSRPSKGEQGFYIRFRLTL